MRLKKFFSILSNPSASAQLVGIAHHLKVTHVETYAFSWHHLLEKYILKNIDKMLNSANILKLSLN